MTVEYKKINEGMTLFQVHEPIPCVKCLRDLRDVMRCAGGTYNVTTHIHCPDCLWMNPIKGAA